jgi:two-component system, NtrC family, sensor kinase
MRDIVPGLFLIFCFTHCFAQSQKDDSLKQVLSIAKEDSNKVNMLLQLSRDYMVTAPAEAGRYSMEAENLARKIEFKSGEAFALKNIGMVYYNQTKYVETIDYWNQSYHLFDSLGDHVNAALLLNNIGSVYMNEGDDARALSYYFKSLQLAEQSGDKHKIALAMTNIGTIYSNNKVTYDKALEYYLKALPMSEALGDKNIQGGLLVNIGETYLNRDKEDSALYYLNRSLEAYEGTENIPYSLNAIGKTYTKKGDYNRAKQYHQKAVAFATNLDLQLDVVQSYLGLGEAYYMNSDYEEALPTFEKARKMASAINLKKELKEAYQGLAETYAALQNYRNAYEYQSLYTNIKDTLFNLDIAQKVSNLQTNFDIQKKQGQIDMLTKDQALQTLELKRQKFARNTLAAGLLFVVAITFVLFKLYRKVRRRTTQLRRSLEELRATQAQLVQSEKMASLGTLTAGIAHEIQNPLNFVNNFSEVNTELLTELEQELNYASTPEAKVLAANIRANEQKINFHGNRADAIVKNMLQHSRTEKGEKQRTDLNAFIDEYLRLSYHGLHAKDKAFHATLETQFDESIEYVDLIPQDIGRVLLNLFNNAFYTVYEKFKNAGNGYDPVISVSTKKYYDKTEIRIKDNGMGISKSVVGKLFQPFFTTKPAGEGTGLGLSLSYDIIKAHGGNIKVETEEGKGTSFIISLPHTSQAETTPAAS